MAAATALPCYAPSVPSMVRTTPRTATPKACAPGNADYPRAAARAETTGTTKIRFRVDASGKLAGVEVLKSSGPSREHKMLDRVATEKLSECTFRPGIDETGKPVGASFDVEYVWKLE